jgi:hypothetical protein
MLEVILVGNTEARRLEAEVRNQRYEVIATVYEDESGWHVEKHSSEKLPDDLVAKIKDKLRQYPNRKGIDEPEGLTIGEYSLWLLSKNQISS